MSNGQVFWIVLAILASGTSMTGVTEALNRIANGIIILANAIREKK